jgi:hypothetical protein
LIIEYAIRRAQENHVGLKLNGTHQLMVCADDVNLPGDNMDTTKKNTKSLFDASEEVGLEVRQRKVSTYMLLSRHQNAGQKHDMKIANRSFENVAQFRYLGTTATNENLIHEEIKGKLNSGNYYHTA